MSQELAMGRLLGHDRGAFTGATAQRARVFEEANGGTLFVDEIGELSLELQPFLLRALEAREVIPIGGHRPKPINVRVICASHRDLRTMVNRELFREDLYHRLVQVCLPLSDSESLGLASQRSEPHLSMVP
jgi:transcriptional regulator with GAF, ATPase, and Fis domain